MIIQRFGRLALLLILFSLITPPVGASTRERQVLPGHVPKQAAGLTPLRAVQSTQQLSLAISLPLRNTNDLAKLLNELYSPVSPNFHHYLSAEEFARQYGPSAEDYALLQLFCQTNGLVIEHIHANRTVLGVSGPASVVEKAFHTTLQFYQHPTESRIFYAPATEPAIELGVPLLHVEGLDNLHPPRSLLKRMTPADTARVRANVGTGVNGSYLGKDFRAAYVPGVTLTGSGQEVALVEFDGYYANDITNYEKAAGLPAATLQNVLVGGFNGHPGSGNGEVALDIQMALSMAPGLQKIMVYEGAPNSPPNNLLNRIATDQAAKQISCSWTWGTYDPGTDQIFQQLAAQGQSYLQASGDGGAYTGPVDAPADNPYVTVVGGTTLTTTAQGAWASETVWSYGSGTGTGGGSSTIYSLPNWQAGIDMSANLGSTSQRNIPDVALVADNVESISDNGQVNELTGTSIAAPLWAGLIALANQQAAANGWPALGWLNPTLYALGKSTNYPSAFHDITTGDNTTPYSANNYPATANYDLCTGWGTPIGGNTIRLLLQVANTQLDHFDWVTSNSPLSVGNPVGVTLTARGLSNSVVTSFVGTASLSALQIQTNVLFSRDFESGTIADWIIQNGPYSRSIDTTSGAAGTRQSLTLKGGDGTNSYNGVSHTLPNLSPDRVEFYVKSVANNTTSGYFVAGATKYRTNSVFHFRLDSAGVMGLTDGPGNFYAVPYSPNQWFHIRLQLNWIAKTIDYYVDDKLVWPNIPFCNTSLTSLAVMNLYNFDNTQAWWDQISLTKNVATAVGLSPTTAASFTAGTWTGTVTISQAGTNLMLVASDNAGHTGTSDPFNVTDTTPSATLVTVIANPTEGGTVTGGGNYPSGSQQTITAIPATGWTFTGWQDGATSNPRIIIVPATNVSYTATFAQPPQITTQPVNQVVNPGQSATFMISAIGSGPLLYQWLRNGNPINSATTTSYVFASAQPSDSGTLFSCLVNSPAGSTTSQTAKLTVRPIFIPVGLAWAKDSFRAYLEAASGAGYTIEVSTNLQVWTSLNILQLTNSSTRLVDTNAVVPYRFYRLSVLQ
jgi:subtilase family serine protease